MAATRKPLFESLQIGSLTLPNRLLMAPVKTAFGAKGGAVTDRLIAYYRRRAEGGVGSIIVEPLFVDPAGKEHPKQLGVESDGRVAGLRRLVDAIHAGGARAIAHINHAGRAANPKASGRSPEAPSAMSCPTTGATAEAMTTARVGELIKGFEGAARRCKEAGFDAIELQAGLGYLLAQFLSPKTNTRTDGYGGAREGRERFAREVVSKMRETLGATPLIVRISATEKVEGGLDLEEGQRWARTLVAWGAQAVHVVSGSACDSPPWYYQHMSLSEGVNERLAGTIREGLGVPVIAAGRLGDPTRMTAVLAAGQADAVALGRPLVVDPDLPLKMREGRDREVIVCGACLQGCLAGVKSGAGIGCIANPEVGHEDQRMSPATSPQKIVVVGGGPAGLMASTIAARRGHSVTLIERQSALGGQFALAHLAPGKAAMKRTLDAMIRAARRSGAQILTGQEADLPSILGLHPDVAILATGATPIVPKIPGLQGAVTGNDVLSGEAKVGARVLIIGGGLVGMETAELLAEQGKTVTVVELLATLAGDMEPITRKLTFKRLASSNVETLTDTKVLRVEGETAKLAGPEGERDLSPLDSIVVTVGTRPETSLLNSLTEADVTLHVVGDAVKPNQITGAVRAAWELAREL